MYTIFSGTNDENWEHDQLFTQSLAGGEAELKKHSLFCAMLLNLWLTPACFRTTRHLASPRRCSTS